MIANANSIIKVCQVLLMLPFTPLLVKATYFIIRGNDEEDKKFELAYISSKHAMSPTTAVLQAVREMERMAQMAETNLIRAMNTLAVLFSTYSSPSKRTAIELACAVRLSDFAKLSISSWISERASLE